MALLDDFLNQLKNAETPWAKQQLSRMIGGPFSPGAQLTAAPMSGPAYAAPPVPDSQQRMNLGGQGLPVAGSFGSAPSSVASPVGSDVAISGALEGATQGSGPLGMLLGGIGGAMSATNAAEKRNTAINQTYQMLMRKGVDDATARAAVSNPAILQQVLQQVFSPAKANRQVINNKLVDVDSGKVIGNYNDANGDNEKTSQGRAAIALKYGLDPNSDAGRAFILTGKLPREDQQALTATDKKAILEADDLVGSNKAAISALNEASTLNPNANQGWFAGARASIGNNLPDLLVPDVISSPESSEATVNLDNAVIGSALTQLKAIFGGNPTEGERKVLLDLQGSSSQPARVRAEIYARAKRLAEARLVLNEERAAQLRGGTFYKPGGGQTPVPGAQPGPSGVGGAPLRAKNEKTGEVIEWNGNQWVPAQ